MAWDLLRSKEGKCPALNEKLPNLPLRLRLCFRKFVFENLCCFRNLVLRAA